MIDNNIPQDDNFVEDLTSLEPDQTTLPSSTENIAATEEAQQQEKQNKRQELFTGKEQTPEHVESTAIAEHKKQVEAQERIAIEKQKKDSAEAAVKQQEIDKIQADLDYAQQHGLESSALEARLKGLEAEKNILIGGEGMQPFPSELMANEPVQGQEVETQEGVKEAPQQRASQEPVINEQPSITKTAEIANQIKAQKTVSQAELIAAQDEAEEKVEITKSVVKKLQTEDDELEKIDPTSFWSNSTVWAKIGMGIAAVYAVASGNAVQLIMKYIDNDMNAQKLNNEQKLAKKGMALKKTAQEIDRVKAMTTNQDKIARLEMAKQKIQQEHMKIGKERLKKAETSAMRDYILKKEVKLESLSPSQIKQIFSPADFKIAKDLRTEYNSETRNMGTNKVVSSYNRIIEAAKNPSAAGDLAMIFNYMKMLDPGSVVRESEFKNAANAGALTDRYAQKAYDQIVSGRFLSPPQRDDFRNRSVKMLKGQLKSQDMINTRYKALSRNSGVPHSLVVDEHNIAELSPREALWAKKSSQNPKLNEKDFNKSVDRLIEQGKLSKKFE